jgi:hypothetical protein
MSADMWLKCPFCDMEIDDEDDDEGNVRVDGLYDIQITKNGKLDTTQIEAVCQKCNRQFK